MTNINRREALKRMAALGLATASSGLILPAFANNNDYRAVVFIFLKGGNDSANMLFDNSSSGYAAYSESRPPIDPEDPAGVHIALGDRLAITSTDGKAYGLHPSMQGIKTLFDENKVAFIANAGMLTELTNREAIENRTAKLPPFLFSHNTQTTLWQSADPNSFLKTGWAGRIMHGYGQDTSSSHLPPLISFKDQATLFRNDSIRPYILSPNGVTKYLAFDSANKYHHASRREVFTQLLEIANRSDFAKELSSLQKGNISTSEAITKVLEAEPLAEGDESTNVNSDLNRSLETIVKVMKNRDTVCTGLSRQMFYVNQGGYDIHNDQLVDQAALLQNLSNSILNFQRKVEAENLQDNVTVVVMSEFGRTIPANDDGTDHGWGGHYFVVGNQVNGKQVYGTMPDLSKDSADIVKRGRLLPTTPTEHYFYPIAKWMGVSDSEMANIFPLYNNFDVIDLGFMKT